MRSILSLFKKKKPDTGIRFIYLDETESTNRYCAEKLRLPADDSQTVPRLVVVSADYQSAGKGQGMNTWESERGKNLLFSILSHPTWVPVGMQFVISECVAVAILDALSRYSEGFTIKWPNDIYWQDQKICGILIENRLSGGKIADCIIGVGIDVNQQEFHGDAPNPVSLWQILGREVDRRELLEEVVRRIDDNLLMILNGDYATIPTIYAGHLYRNRGFHTYRDVSGEFEAAIVEVEDDGHLVLRDRNGQIRSYAFKEIEFII